VFTLLRNRCSSSPEYAIGRRLSYLATLGTKEVMLD
jgi:hypothetical protein